MKTPLPETQEEVIRLRCMSKQGRLHPDDQKFLENIWKEYPEWYATTDKIVFEMTKPFGAR
jgi:acyl-coenzyme A synthetase/AMP-(fatty) acid ligase